LRDDLLQTLTESLARGLARRTSRRGLIGRLGLMLAGSGSIPLLPIARAAGPAAEQAIGSQTIGAEGPAKGYPGVAPQPSLGPEEQGDPASCDYWRYCGTHGPLCACCGGSANACPPGTEMSLMGWIGTCRNPVDGKNYIISYNDCCGKALCGRCWCDRASQNPKNLPPVRPQASADILWCVGTKETYPTCTSANVLGVALDQTAGGSS
jgi:methylamine dehydrogenase light chain